MIISIRSSSVKRRNGEVEGEDPQEDWSQAVAEDPIQTLSPLA